MTRRRNRTRHRYTEEEVIDAIHACCEHYNVKKGETAPSMTQMMRFAGWNVGVVAKRYFGSWAAALEHCGYKVNRTTTRVVRNDSSSDRE